MAHTRRRFKHIKPYKPPCENGRRYYFQTCDGVQHEIIGRWDLIIAHPPCTYLSFAGNGYFNREKYGDMYVYTRLSERFLAAHFFMQFLLADCDKVCVENPTGFMNQQLGSADQVIHPYFFAKDENDTRNYHLKRTCLWLKGLTPLKRTNNLPKPKPLRNDNTLRAANRYITETFRNQKNRSKTFPAIANAMADQWG